MHCHCVSPKISTQFLCFRYSVSETIICSTINSAHCHQNASFSMELLWESQCLQLVSLHSHSRTYCSGFHIRCKKCHKSCQLPPLMKTFSSHSRSFGSLTINRTVCPKGKKKSYLTRRTY